LIRIECTQAFNVVVHLLLIDLLEMTMMIRLIIEQYKNHQEAAYRVKYDRFFFLIFAAATDAIALNVVLSIESQKYIGDTS